MSEKSPMHIEEQLLALTALAAKDPGPPDPCPPDEQLAAFIDGQLRGRARDTMLAHLNQCDSCRQHWLEVAALVSAEETEPAPAEPQGAGLLTDLLEGLRSLFVPRRLALAATAAAAITLVVNLSLSPDLAERVDTQFAAANPSVEILEPVAQSMPLPWESGALGFGEQSIAAANRAFGAGVWDGRAALSGTASGPTPEALLAPDQGNWSDTPWNPYYQFGRWAVLLWTRLGAEQKIPHWDEQLRVVRELQSEIPAGDPGAGAARRALSALEQQLAMLSDETPEGDARALRRRLFLTLQQLAPTAL